MMAHELVLPKLVETHTNGLVTVSGYQTVAGISQLDGKSLMVLDSLLVFYEGELQFPHFMNDQLIKVVDGKPRLPLGTLSFGEKCNSRWIVLATVENETTGLSVQDRQRAIIGLLNLLVAEDFVSTKAFEYQYTLEGKAHHCYTSSVVSPVKMMNTSISTRLVDVLGDLDRQLAIKENALVPISLRWFSESTSSRGVDAYLKCWIATELLFVRKQNVVKAITTELSKAYLMVDREAKITFRIGRLYNMRNRIVHEGFVRPLHHILTDLLSAIYYDLLLHRLLGKATRKAHQLITEEGDVIDNELREWELREKPSSGVKRASTTQHERSKQT